MANVGNEMDTRDFEPNLKGTPWARKILFLSSVFNKFLKRYLLCGFVYISDFFSAK